MDFRCKGKTFLLNMQTFLNFLFFFRVKTTILTTSARINTLPRSMG